MSVWHELFHLVYIIIMILPVIVFISISLPSPKPTTFSHITTSHTHHPTVFTTTTQHTHSTHTPTPAPPLPNTDPTSSSLNPSPLSKMPSSPPTRPTNPTPYSIRNLVPAPLFSTQPSSSTASVAPLRLTTKPDSSLPSSSNNRSLPNINHYHRISIHPAHGSTPAKVQYWIAADHVLGDRLKETNVPRGHWAQLVQLAKTACDEWQQGLRDEKVRVIITALYCPDGDGEVEMAVETHLLNEE
jgi:hypothetical protein